MDLKNTSVLAAIECYVQWFLGRDAKNITWSGTSFVVVLATSTQLRDRSNRLKSVTIRCREKEEVLTVQPFSAQERPLRSVWLVEYPIRPTLPDVRAALGSLMRRKWGNGTAQKVGTAEVFALVGGSGATYRGKLIISRPEKCPWDGKKPLLLGAKRLITMEGKKCGWCRDLGKGHNCTAFCRQTAQLYINLF